MEKPNILIDPLPETLVVKGRKYSVNTDFRIGIMFEQLMIDPGIELENKADIALHLFYGDDIPDDHRAATDELLWYYSCGKLEKNAGESDNGKQQRSKAKDRCYDYDADAAYIYAAFLDQYGIDLSEAELHWWKFQALFMALKSDNEICKIMEYRSIDLSKIKNKKERARMAELKARFALPSLLTKEDKVAIAGAAFASG